MKLTGLRRLLKVNVRTIPAQPGRTLVLAGAGTPSLTLAVRVSQRLVPLGAGQEWLGAITADWNSEAIKLKERVSRGLYRLAPTGVLPGLPHGFGANPALAQRYQYAWREWLEKAFWDLRRRSTELGLVGGLVVEALTLGGHLPVASAVKELAGEHFPQAAQVGLLHLPTDAPRSRLWQNFEDRPPFPDDLGIPVILVDNRYRPRVDAAVPLLFAGALAYRRLVDPAAWSAVEVFAQVTAASRVLGVAYARREIPIVGRGFLGLGEPVVSAEELPQRLGELLAEVLDQRARLSPGEPDLEAMSVVVATGFPRRRPEARLEFEETVRQVAEKIRGPLPPGLRLLGLPKFWAVENRAQLEAVLLYPVRAQSARAVIEGVAA